MIYIDHMLKAYPATDDLSAGRSAQQAQILEFYSLDQKKKDIQWHTQVLQMSRWPKRIYNIEMMLMIELTCQSVRAR